MTCCEFLLHQIAFYKDQIRPCCSFSLDNFENSPLISGYDGNIEKIKEYFEKRNHFINIFKNGGKPICYKDCTTYSPCYSQDTSFKLNNLIISNQTKCSFNCIYCEHARYGKDSEYRKWLNNREPYDIKPILMYLRENNYIAENCRFLICGGECSEYPIGELEYLIYFAMSCNCQLLILSSGLNYSKSIEYALKSTNAVLKISIDSGTKATFEKIKRVKAYNRVWNNIKKYIESSDNNNESRVELKYIVIPEVNDNIEEIDAFLEKCRKTGCLDIILDIEHEYVKENKNNIEAKKHLSKIFNYFFEKVTNYETMPTHLSFEGVEEDWLWSLVDDKYNYKNGINK